MISDGAYAVFVVCIAQRQTRSTNRNATFPTGAEAAWSGSDGHERFVPSSIANCTDLALLFVFPPKPPSQQDMADAVAALGLAANILQVLEYGSKFVTTAWKIWRSGKDVDIFSTLQSLSENLKSVANDLQPADSTQQGTSAIHIASERAIFDTASECRKVAQEILESLDKIGLEDAVRTRRKRDAARASFKVIWKSEDIKALEAKFEGVKSQLTLNLAASLR